MRVMLLLLCLAAGFAQSSALVFHWRWVEEGVAEIGAHTDTIPPYAFAGNPVLREVRFAGAPVEIGEGAFFDCAALSAVELPEGVRKIGKGTFRDCTWLRRVSLPQSLADIGSHAFVYCNSLESVAIPDSVRHIGSNAFSRCTALKEIRIPDSVTELESYAFSDCTGLRRAKLPRNPAMLGELIFSGCSSLESVCEPSPEPPSFDCSSQLFEPDDAESYSRCRLEVAPGCREAYSEHPGWGLFRLISEGEL